MPSDIEINVARKHQKSATNPMAALAGGSISANE
ncbi:hypothetical protein LCGC14_0075470 [marine sediment metagenome]|uniref:Uncharacterized protein n=1 Tax=marine sediment metagenome TaxID=412755 RepID=A0A0F9VJM7_9ZZZZ